MKRVFSALALSMLLTIVGCGSESPDSQFPRGVTADSIKIGSHTDLSGVLAMWGVPMTNGLRQRFDELAEAGGVHGRSIDFVVEDSQYQLPLAVKATNKLINLDEAKTEPGVYRGFFVAWATSGMPGYDSEAYWRERFAEEFPLGKTDEVALDFDIRGRIALNSGVFEPGMRGIPDSKGKDFQEATGKSKERPRGVYRPDSIEIPVGQVAEKLHA